MVTTKRLWAFVALEALVIAALIAVLAVRGGEKGGSAGAGPAPAASNGGGNAAEGSGGAAAKTVARIDGHTFTMGELQGELSKRYGATLLNQLLDRQAIMLEGKALGIGVSPEDIDKELKRMQQGYENEAQFYDSMKKQLGMTRDQIREDTLYKLLLERIATRNVKIGDDEVDAYIREHPEEFERNVELHLAQIISASKELADKAYAELAKGADFAVVARDRSLDEATASGGGDLGWVEEDDPFVPAPLMKAAQTLKPGTYSRPVALDGGRYGIVQLMERRQKKSADPQAIREQVRKQLALSAAPPLQDLVKQLRDKYHADIIDPAFNM
ncbi:peptidyl-prolyl cis-trans isomerase [Gordoniibacillus kamchatkensis]|uniref:peptidyl-prolyl cis-trans isomerase n=1 Tax=Gordoniibacillus kamchatkensis TaxID=1590651 RepID=UPI000697B1E5|nr:peptidyl-prolyl cis-trans isomerase [Paenibacillus sp. VKM B-2647]